MVTVRYADLFSDWLVLEGYTHCFFVPGGNIMHILDAARRRFTCIPFVHEVSAGIAAEYFNEQSKAEQRAFVLVTAGPGLTNIVTAMAGAYLESRELLVVGGQAKSDQMASNGVRQLGHQEIGGLDIVQSICKNSLRITRPVSQDIVFHLVREGQNPRKGPIFIEFCLDAQASQVSQSDYDCGDVAVIPLKDSRGVPLDEFEKVSVVCELLARAQRPLLLIGGGVDRGDALEVVEMAERWGIPVATTWNAADRISADHPLYFGRPGNWGMRWSNILIQQADLIVAAGTRLSLWETGFNWEEFAPMADIVQIDIDDSELQKGQPEVFLGINADAMSTLQAVDMEWDKVLLARDDRQSWSDWLTFGSQLRSRLPLAERSNRTAEGFVDPYDFFSKLSAISRKDDVIIPCSSGGAFTVAFQALELKNSQKVTSTKALASMGYGLAGAIGASLANDGKRTLLFEGDGSFAQNMQELGTLVANNLPIKIFLFDNNGYGSIRANQLNYFDGAYMGCDAQTGLVFPDWLKLFGSYGIPTLELSRRDMFSQYVCEFMDSSKPAAFIVPIDPEQTYYPRITSLITANGEIKSNPLHMMDPPLSITDSAFAYRYINPRRIDE